MKVDPCDPLKTLNLHYVIIFIKSVFNKDKNNNYYNIFLGEGSHELSINKDSK